MPARDDLRGVYRGVHALVVLSAVLALAWLHGGQCATGLLGPALASASTDTVSVGQVTPRVGVVLGQGPVGQDLTAAVGSLLSEAGILAHGTGSGSGVLAGTCLLLLTALAFLVVNLARGAYVVGATNPDSSVGARLWPSPMGTDQPYVLRT
jgi:hypothetical protein